MFGNGIGSLSVSISDTRESQERDIWSLTGEAGNAWYQAEVPVSNANPFKVISHIIKFSSNAYILKTNDQILSDVNLSALWKRK